MVFQDLRGGSISQIWKKTVVNSHVSRKTPRVILIFQALTWILLFHTIDFVKRQGMTPVTRPQNIEALLLLHLRLQQKRTLKKKKQSAKNTHLAACMTFLSTFSTFFWLNLNQFELMKSHRTTQSSASVTEVENSWTAKVKRSRGCKAPRFQALKCCQLPFALVDSPMTPLRPAHLKATKKERNKARLTCSAVRMGFIQRKVLFDAVYKENSNNRTHRTWNV